MSDYKDTHINSLERRLKDAEKRANRFSAMYDEAIFDRNILAHILGVAVGTIIILVFAFV